MEVSLQAVLRTDKVNLGGAASDMAAGLIHEKSHNRAMRGRENGLLPPKESSATLVVSLAAVGNATTAEIKEEVNPETDPRLLCQKGTQILVFNYIFSAIK
jgi:hypothetical protein